MGSMGKLDAIENVSVKYINKYLLEVALGAGIVAVRFILLSPGQSAVPATIKR